MGWKINLVVTYNLISFVIMGKNKKNIYRPVNELPVNSMRVSDYADYKGYNSTPYIYELWRKKDKKNIPFEIVDFKGVNFIIHTD